MENKIVEAGFTPAQRIIGFRGWHKTEKYMLPHEVYYGYELQGIFIVIITDKETGVMYLFKRDYRSGGLSVMLDAEGKPLINEKYRK